MRRRRERGVRAHGGDPTTTTTTPSAAASHQPCAASSSDADPAFAATPSLTAPAAFGTATTRAERR